MSSSRRSSLEHASAWVGVLDKQLLPRLPTCSRTLDISYRRGRRSLTRDPAAGGPPALSTLGPADVRRRDVAVIVASGPSANELADVRAPEDRFDLFLLNHASALPVTGRLYSIEDPVLKGRQRGMHRQEAIDLLAWSIRRGRALTSDAPLVVRGSWHDEPTRDVVQQARELGARILLAPRFALPVHGRSGAKRYATWASKRHPFRWPEGNEPVLSPRGGLGFLLSLCIGLRYETIVMLGVDMSSDEYFFDLWAGDPALDQARRNLAPPSGEPHLTAVSTPRRASMASLVVALDRWYLRPRGRRLLVGSTTSALHPALRATDLSTLR